MWIWFWLQLFDFFSSFFSSLEFVLSLYCENVDSESKIFDLRIEKIFFEETKNISTKYNWRGQNWVETKDNTFYIIRILENMRSHVCFVTKKIKSIKPVAWEIGNEHFDLDVMSFLIRKFRQKKNQIAFKIHL